VLALAVLTACGGGADDPGAAVDPGYGAGVATSSADATTAATSTAVSSTAEASTSGPSASETEAESELVIVISDFDYELPDAVPPGAAITIRNEDGVGHTVTADDGTFDVVVGPGEEATLTAPDQPGEFPFHCTPHPAMVATLVVEG
jgi:plastocyanin